MVVEEIAVCNFYMVLVVAWLVDVFEKSPDISLLLREVARVVIRV